VSGHYETKAFKVQVCANQTMIVGMKECRDFHAIVEIMAITHIKSEIQAHRFLELAMPEDCITNLPWWFKWAC
jgi:hypothetical protein